MIIDIQKEQMHFEAGDVLRIKDNGIISTIFEAHSTAWFIFGIVRGKQDDLRKSSLYI